MMLRRPAGIVGIVLLGWAIASGSVFGEDPGSGSRGKKYYTEPPMFHPYPDENAVVQSIDRLGPVGIGIELLQPAFRMRIKNVEAGSPAAATGRLRKGQWIDTLNGRALEDRDPRQILGETLAQAEATDGVIRLAIREDETAASEEVVVRIPVLGAYSATWPLDCQKSDKIVRGLADFVAANGPGSMGLGTLFLLSTGEPKDLEVVRGWMREMADTNRDKTELGAYPWYVGYGGPALCEYYLRTGDESVLHTIRLYVKAMGATQFNGAWGHRGIGQLGYSASGHMNAAGVHVLTFLLLARECGVQVDDAMLGSALGYFFRYAGRGNVPYGDNLPETSFVDNGKTGGLAFAMQAAVTLTPDGERTIYAAARDISALKSFYSTSWMLHGHTGGGIGEIWRGAAMALVWESRPGHYRQFMDERAWFYDLSRRFDGSIGILGGGGKYDDPGNWGIGMGLVYTLPRKHLRLAGAAPTRFCKNHPLPDRPWGNTADDRFYSLAASPDENGRVANLDGETLRDEGSGPILLRLRAPDVTEPTMLRYARHPELGIREYAAGTIRGRDDLTIQLLKSDDPRLRYTGIQALTQIDPTTTPLLLEMVNRPEESWWVTRAAMDKLRAADPQTLAPHIDRLLALAGHPDDWLSTASLAVLANLAADPSHHKTILTAVCPMAARSTRPSVVNALTLIMDRLRTAPPEVQRFGLAALAQVYTEFPASVQTPGGRTVESAEPLMIERMAKSLVSLPGGYDKLYELGERRYPDDVMPHKQIFLSADAARLGPTLKAIVRKTVLEDVVPHFIAQTNHIASNRRLLLEETRSTVPFRSNFYYRRPRTEDLADYYRKAGITEYEWQDFGPPLSQMVWDYFTFDPPEQKLADGGTRYRKVTYPEGMENWYAPDFDPRKAGWKSGPQPFGQADGKLLTERQGCSMDFCRHGEPMRSLWDKEVLLVRGTFAFPRFREGYRYRLLIGGISHVNSGEGFELYVDGKKLMSRNRGIDKREGGSPMAYYIDKAWWPAFQSGRTTLAATTFRRIGQKNVLGRDIFFVWLQEMKAPPFGEGELLESVRAVPMLTARWQAADQPRAAPEDSEIQEPVRADPEQSPEAAQPIAEAGRAPDDRAAAGPDDGRFRWDGKFAPNPAVRGDWVQVGVTPTIEAFTPKSKLRLHERFPRQITFRDDGRTDDPLLFYSGDIFLHLDLNQALKISPRLIDGQDYLFIEAGGFDRKLGKDWKCPLVVMRRK